MRPGVVVPGFFKIIVSWTLIYFLVSPVSDLMTIALMDQFNTTRLYEIRLGGTKVMSVDFNKILYYYLLLTLVPSNTTIPCIHSFSRPSCSLLWNFPCVWVPWSCNHHPCGCLTHASINIYRNMRALDDEVVLGEVRWKEQEACWCYCCHFSHIWRKEVASVIDSNI